MRNVRRAVLAGVAVGLVAACGSSSSTTGPSLPNIVGTWQATKFEFVKIADPATKVELVAAGGSAVLVFGANQSFSATLSFPGSQPEVSSGTFTVTATTATITITNTVPTQVLNFALVLSGNTLSLTGGTATFDFGTGDVPATVNITMTRQ